MARDMKKYELVDLKKKVVVDFGKNHYPTKGELKRAERYLEKLPDRKGVVCITPDRPEGEEDGRKQSKVHKGNLQ